MNLTILLTLLLTATITINLAKRDRRLLLIAVLIGITYTISLPAQAMTLAALGAQDSAITQQQQKQEEGLKLTPGGGQYSGLEQVEKPNGTQSDAAIKQKIAEIRNDLTVNSASGSVILSGTVENKETAQQLVEQVKAIPGVKEVTFELGLQNPAS